MFEIRQSIKIITIDQDYIKALYDCCDQVFYMPSNYGNKPYIGILIEEDNGRKYAIPLTSAKGKHKTWKNLNNGNFLIFEDTNVSDLTDKDIYVPNDDESCKHILSVLVVPKMIPIKDGLYSIVNINQSPCDSVSSRKYKHLLQKELSFCIHNKSRIIKEANRIYSRQMKTGNIFKGYCDFKALESASDRFQK